MFQTKIKEELPKMHEEIDPETASLKWWEAESKLKVEQMLPPQQDTTTNGWPGEH